MSWAALACFCIAAVSLHLSFRLWTAHQKWMAETLRRTVEEYRLASLPELPDADPSWVVLGWNRDGEHLVMASNVVKVASFQERRRVERAVAPGGASFNLTRRECDLSLAFPVYTLLHDVYGFDAAVGELRRVWRDA